MTVIKGFYETVYREFTDPIKVDADSLWFQIGTRPGAPMKAHPTSDFDFDTDAHDNHERDVTTGPLVGAIVMSSGTELDFEL